jgi:DNA-binding LacI/PurR family transcriptional regulator
VYHKKAPTTLEDIARHLHISRATVSNALSGNRPVSAATKKQVEEACVHLGYRMNTLARSLRTSRTKIIGVTVPDILEPYLAVLVTDVEVELKRHGYEMLLGSYFFDSDEEIRILQTFRSLMVDGILAISGRDDTLPAYRDLVRQIPTVFLGRDPMGAPISSVGSDDFSQGEEAVDYLATRGHTRMAHLTIEYSNFRILKGRAEGFLHGLKKHNLPSDESSVIVVPRILTHEIDYTLEYARQVYQRLREMDATAVFVVSDYVAIALVKGLTSMGVAVPRDLSLVSVTNTPYVALTTPTITSFDLAPQIGARDAVDLLMKQLGRGRNPVVHLTIPHTLVERESVLDSRASR